MDDLARLLVTLALAGAAFTFLGSAAIWLTHEERRIRRAMRRVLGAPAEALIIAPGRGRGAGLSTQSGLLATAWDKGAWCLVYRLDEVEGAELLVDGEVVGRAFRGETRRPLDRIPAQARQVMLRLVFDDARYPDFEMELWAQGDETRREAPTATGAAQTANQWLARIEAVVRRPRPPRPQVTAAPPPVTRARPPARPAPPHPPLPGDQPELDLATADDDDPPWDEDDGDLFDGLHDHPEQRN
ncbi:MAG: hypothetical protein ACK4RV_00670 [Caulobacter sp.]